MTQPTVDHPELNPFNMEHRVTVLEVTQLRTTEQIGNMALSIEKLTQAVSKMEEQRVAEMVIVHESIDTIIDGIKTRQLMTEQSAKDFAAGRASVEVRIPTRQMLAIILGLGGVAGALGAIFTLITQFR